MRSLIVCQKPLWVYYLKKKCDLTIDELLDKISDKGINSLTEEEKNKLDEYSKTIN